LGKPYFQKRHGDTENPLTNRDRHKLRVRGPYTAHPCLTFFVFLRVSVPPW
jgi:hypothetical protein